ncbi:uncharacterized protein B0H64DRAFT_375534 [Chaetomium fimeti]|uniref:F-box domain-containing protein n=1 Tax=Chaetomium fimeti TaxID=1854472 RepID=A0AAE0LRP2_9PEZI|nr:hypothetical protein B0H64DRAFT_375534 [Chaetomium fimeti]
MPTTHLLDCNEDVLWLILGYLSQGDLRNADLREALSFVERTQLPYRDIWAAELRAGTIDAHLAVLLSQLPRLQDLRLSNKFYQKCDLVALVLRSMLCDSHSGQPIPGFSSTSLHQLHTVDLERYPGLRLAPETRNTECILPLFYLPSIKDMSISMPDPPEPEFPWPTSQPPSALGLRTLRLHHIREAHLGQVLAAAPRLHTLHWNWRYDPDTEDQFNTPTVNLDLLLPALLPLRDTLTTLDIFAFSLFSPRPYIPFPLHVQGSMHPLSTFPHLTTLTIPLVFFTGFPLPIPHTTTTTGLSHSLPPNLEALTLTDDLYADIDTEEPWDVTGHVLAVRAWLAAGAGADVRARTPRLRSVVLVLRGEDDEVCEEERAAREEIRGLARGAGIGLDIRRDEEAGVGMVWRG